MKDVSGLFCLHSLFHSTLLTIKALSRPVYSVKSLLNIKWDSKNGFIFGGRN